MVNSLDPEIQALFGDEGRPGTDADLDGVIDATAAPELATALGAQAMEDPTPRMEDAPPGLVQLPAGYLTEEGDLITTAIVRELTGRDEERLAKIDPANLPLYFQTLTECGVERIGTEPATKEMLKSLLLGDREALVLGIRIATYGAAIPMHMTCPFCQAEEDLEFELDKDVPSKAMENPEVREFDVVLRDGRIAVVTPATVGVYDKIWDPKKTGAEIKTSVLEHCVLSIDGRPVNRSVVQNLGSADRKTLLLHLSEIQPGPQYEEVGLDCGSCGKNVPIRLDLADLFR